MQTPTRLAHELDGSCPYFDSTRLRLHQIAKLAIVAAVQAAADASIASRPAREESRYGVDVRDAKRIAGARVAVLVLLLAICYAVASAPTRAHAAAQPFGIEVSGNHLTALGGGPAIRLLGVDRSGAEYLCVGRGDRTVFQGPTNASSIQAIKSWHTNAVRVPLNEDCWLGINGANPQLSGVHYRRAVERYVAALNAAGL